MYHRVIEGICIINVNVVRIGSVATDSRKMSSKWMHLCDNFEKNRTTGLEGATPLSPGARWWMVRTVIGWRRFKSLRFVYFSDVTLLVGWQRVGYIRYVKISAIYSQQCCCRSSERTILVGDGCLSFWQFSLDNDHYGGVCEIWGEWRQQSKLTSTNCWKNCREFKHLLLFCFSQSLR